MIHIPVLLDPILSEIAKISTEFVAIDCTFGFGGYSRSILENDLCKKLIAIDRDESVKKFLLQDDRFEFFCTEFSNIDQVCKQKVDIIVADFGISSMQVDDGLRGFSFSKDAELDMRMDLSLKKTAFDVVNSYKESELCEIISLYGDERLAKKISYNIVAKRAKKPIVTTIELADIICESYGSNAFYTKIHPATKTFQAIRIEVNNELFHIETMLEKSVSMLNNGGLLICVSFHELEDRIVKEFFKEKSMIRKKINKYKQNQDEEICYDLEVVTKSPILPSGDEVRRNPRARSGRLRIAKKI